ncbi:hypothetical protein SAMN05216474_0326 [Lishizhenia tianjinensis]|uniref:Transglutaminase-like superfamily protein n=1 Tax=Lishizhenia tianjinensis TaxID=477690 RepID=A0A1I6XMQ8_9FLAO|nr:hypothetical protein [Lishizhenia tianjinensis]SFT39655.1 hypothetical protein SAMN05216474_0326 [Lishizhenia tianjinensis]
MHRRKIKFLSYLGLMITLVLFNWYFSDYAYLRGIISDHQLENPDDIYEFIINETPSTREKNTGSCLYCSPQYLLEENLALSCDEGAILIAHLSYLLGYESRLVDLIGTDGIAHHTLVEVHVDNTWQRYDYLFERKNSPYTTDVNFEFSHPSYRAFPKWYNKLIYNFYGLKYLAVKLRGARG